MKPYEIVLETIATGVANVALTLYKIMLCAVLGRTAMLTITSAPEISMVAYFKELSEGSTPTV